MTPSSDVSISRRRLLAAVGASTAIAGCSSDGSDENGTGGDSPGESGGTADGALSAVPDAITLEPVATGLERPVGLAAPAEGSPWYVVLQGGRIVGLDADGGTIGTALDLGDGVETGGNEQGLLGLALHPEFASNRRAFVRYSAPPPEDAPADPSHTFVLSEFAVSEDGTEFLSDSERRLLEIPEPQRNHNAGNVVFGPEGYLYVPVGDGGAGGDQGDGHVEDWYDGVGGGNGQDVTENLLGSILRIDVDGGDPYDVPADNPLVGEPGLDEHYAWGFRNPWGISWDDDAFYVADVGQSSYEEVDLVEAGGNYGWNVKEGTHCFGAEDCPDRTPSDVHGGEPLLDPIVEYPHTGGGITGISIIGGHVYRGDAIPELQGIYVFGDLAASNQLFATASDGGEGAWPTTTITTQGVGLQTLFALERDPAGELYVLGASEAVRGAVWRIAGA